MSPTFSQQTKSENKTKEKNTLYLMPLGCEGGLMDGAVLFIRMIMLLLGA